MQPYLRPPRTPSNLSESVQHHLNAYALAASAAGVGMLALLATLKDLLRCSSQKMYLLWAEPQEDGSELIARAGQAL